MVNFSKLQQELLRVNVFNSKENIVRLEETI